MIGDRYICDRRKVNAEIYRRRRRKIRIDRMIRAVGFSVILAIILSFSLILSAFIMYVFQKH